MPSDPLDLTVLDVTPKFGVAETRYGSGEEDRQGTDCECVSCGGSYCCCHCCDHDN